MTRVALAGLSKLLSPHVPLGKSRLETLCLLVLGVISARTVSLLCPCGCGEMHKIGEDRTERLDIVPAKLRVIVTVRPKYACRSCTDGVTQAPAPAHLIEGGLPTEGAIAHVLVGKYADHLPLYRQRRILARSGIEIHRSTLADWVGTAAFHLGPVSQGYPRSHRRRPSARPNRRSLALELQAVKLIPGGAQRPSWRRG